MAGYVSNNLPTSKCYFLKKIYLPCLKTVKLPTCSFFYHPPSPPPPIFNPPNNEC